MGGKSVAVSDSQITASLAAAVAVSDSQSTASLAAVTVFPVSTGGALLPDMSAIFAADLRRKAMRYAAIWRRTGENMMRDQSRSGSLVRFTIFPIGEDMS